MSRDYKTRPNSSSPPKRSRNSLVVGIFIGYALGLLTAIAIWLYINKGPSPFISPEKNAESPISKSGAAGPSSKGVQFPGSPDKSAEGKPRFEFYNMLPNAEETTAEQQLKQAAPQPSSKDKYFLQAGSFQNESDADNLKAKLAMLGVEAVVQAVNVPEKKGTWHRVRIGPFSTIDELNQVRSSLQQNGVQSSLIKVAEGKQ